LAHKFEQDHPESPERLRKIMRRLGIFGLSEQVDPICPSSDPLPYSKLIYSQSRLVSVLEGGHNAESLALAVESHVRELPKR
jgi:acetoin utilization deacetylase AcuC-like enzyme